MNKEQYDEEMRRADDAQQEEQETSIAGIRSNIVEKLKELCKIRNAVEELSATLRIKKEEWDKANVNEIGGLDMAKKDLVAAETELRELALADYAISKEKKLIGGLGIRVLKKLEYSKDTAFEWAKEHSLCLQLDKRAFEKIAKSQDIKWVEITEVPSATIPSTVKI